MTNVQQVDIVLNGNIPANNALNHIRMNQQIAPKNVESLWAKIVSHVIIDVSMQSVIVSYGSILVDNV
eukprot:CAMPEP_0201582512 /NCGR_PEP_ID=MMETSP0190_2-20130828/86419_1 /ASSEMBLY_ACC=CAM_ASM_000263 /TAXON_ID=37353 /ORGANISM="Rosalina sp." /LENGTH=67 /DNA_ID=CAMNT_0048022585 /DNA_START=81 /DNA_END=281 /DNA_ORIENTATION=-